MKWIEALRKFNEGTGTWCIPKKGTKEYEAVRDLMAGKVKKPEPPSVQPEPEPVAPAKPSISPAPKPEALIPKTIDESIKDYIEEVAKANGDPYNLDYSAAGFITDYIFLYLLEKYPHECGVYVIKKYGENVDSIFFNAGVNLEYKSKMKKKEVKAFDYYKYQIGKRIYNCLRAGAKLVAIPFSSENHANMIIYRKVDNTFEHFEPHGSAFGGENPEQHNAAIDHFKSWIKDWEAAGFIPKGSQFISADKVCPLERGFQAKEGREKYEENITGRGLCQMWSLFYLEMCLKYPDVPAKELVTKAFLAMYKMGKLAFRTHIAKYTHELNMALRKYINKDVNVTAESLKENRALRREMNGIFLDKIKAYINKDKPSFIVATNAEKGELAQRIADLQKKKGKNENDKYELKILKEALEEFDRYYRY